ncbi:MAG: winged helix-turn-helix domain-containing protein [Holophagales bacterium]|nr:winged helix-turn-helix domain-containing protein [Holophagales bacterium]
MRLRIGDLSFDVGRRLLHRGPEEVHLSPKAFQLLALLLARRPDAVSKSEIQGSLWPGSSASDGHLAAIVCEVRHALGAGAEGATRVRTVHGFGYAFEGPVQETPDLLRHVLVRGRQEVGLVPGGNLLGRERRRRCVSAPPSRTSTRASS